MHIEQKPELANSLQAGRTKNFLQTVLAIEIPDSLGESITEQGLVIADHLITTHHAQASISKDNGTTRRANRMADIAQVYICGSKPTKMSNIHNLAPEEIDPTLELFAYEVNNWWNSKTREKAEDPYFDRVLEDWTAQIMASDSSALLNSQPDRRQQRTPLIYVEDHKARSSSEELLLGLAQLVVEPSTDSWWKDANCKDLEGKPVLIEDGAHIQKVKIDFFAETAAFQRAFSQICIMCPVAAECLSESLIRRSNDSESEPTLIHLNDNVGVAGGLTAIERRNLHRTIGKSPIEWATKFIAEHKPPVVASNEITSGIAPVDEQPLDASS
jgi:hypothetical protein